MLFSKNTILVKWTSGRDVPNSTLCITPYGQPSRNISFSGSRYTVYAMHNALQYESYKFRVVEGATESDVVQFITRKLQLKKTKQKTSQFG